MAQAVQRRVRAGGARGAVAERAGDLGVEAAGHVAHGVHVAAAHERARVAALQVEQHARQQ
ncbi:hypothetical protein EG859_15430, partial [Enterococcus faecalis]